MIDHLKKCYRGELSIAYTLAYWVALLILSNIFASFFIDLKGEPVDMVFEGKKVPYEPPTMAAMLIWSLITLSFVVPFFKKFRSSESGKISKYISGILTIIFLLMSVLSIFGLYADPAKPKIVALEGEATPEEYQQSFKWYLNAAQNGQIDAMFHVAKAYFNGRGVEQDHGEAHKWFLKAAQLGHGGSQSGVAALYQMGAGVGQNDIAAHQWFLAAAENGQVDAMYNVGLNYLTGRGVEQSDEEANKWFQKAAELGHVGAQNKVGPAR